MQHEKEEIRYSEVKTANTQVNVVSPIKQNVCTSTREGENFIKTLEEYMRNTHTSR